MQEESFRPGDAQVLDLPDDKEKARLATDPLYRMEREKERLGSLTEAKAQIAQLVELSKARGADGADTKWNRKLKQDMRVRRREEQALDRKRQEMGLSDNVKLLPETAEDVAGASHAIAQHSRPAVALVLQRKSILHQDIFSSARKPRLRKAGTKSAKVKKPSHLVANTCHTRHKAK